MADDQTTNQGAKETPFEAALKEVRAIKKNYVESRISYYKDRTPVPRFMFRTSGVITIILSAGLPALAIADFPHKTAALTVTSITIAALTGLNSFYRWERRWRGNSIAQVAIEQLCAKWELELINARLIIPEAGKIDHVYKATNDLLVNVQAVLSSESEEFFNTLQFPQQNSAAKPSP
jgi:hypothetical protein